VGFPRACSLPTGNSESKNFLPEARSSLMITKKIDPEE
jgi:hypothetical protein